MPGTYAQAREYLIVATLSGATGSIVTDVPVTGYIEAVSLEFTGVPGTTVAALTETNAPSRTILSNTGNTNVVKYPSVQRTDTSGTAIAGVYSRILVMGQFLQLGLTVSGAGTVKARILVSEI